MTIIDLIMRGVGDHPAIAAPEQTPLSYAGLRDQVRAVATQFNAHGLGANDRVAIVLPNGAEMASVFVALASVVASAPLNPSYTDPEFEFYLSDLNAKAIILAEGSDTAARDVAKRLGIFIIELRSIAECAGRFELDFGSMERRNNDAVSIGNDIALVLHTSGTTSRPKIVPLSQANLCASALNIQSALNLTSKDRCLNVMPLFHIHGLIAAVLSSLAAGASTTCTQGFNALKFFSWMQSSRPTWYTAVPTMHQAILDRVDRNEAIIAEAELRFIRSSSSSLPAPVMTQLENAFSCPVIESYGMTEAAHQMTSNRLPPGARKAGSVGIAAGPEVCLMDEHGLFVGPGEEGEIVIRGSNVTAGYEANDQANASAFTADPNSGNDWFRTGDQGVFDADGFLRISGRLKEIINRGGEKIAPREVDDVLIEHPAVAQVVTFSVPHLKLGEDVAAAIVLREGMELTDRELRDFASASLAAFKVPKQIIFVDEIPKGSTGKLQRIGLAKKLGLG
jgi:acyl-CoA synthetase (AMP-forming)/AMP-acid ligase II